LRRLAPSWRHQPQFRASPPRRRRPAGLDPPVVGELGLPEADYPERRASACPVASWRAG